MPAATVAGSRGDRRAREAPDLLPPPPPPALLLFSSLRCRQPRLPARAATDVRGKRPREAPAPAEDDAPMGCGGRGGGCGGRRQISSPRRRRREEEEVVLVKEDEQKQKHCGRVL
uniref:Uncharacterized protein n=1 Tax=Oryza rufipogon TaxID=4529 RepID=A0A0E0RJ95_ORYRU